MRIGVRTVLAAMLMISGPAMAGGVLGADDKAGLWEDQLHSNIGFFISRDFIAGKLSPRQMQQASDDMMRRPGGTRHICGTREQAQHPRILVSAALTCPAGPVTINGRTALYDVTCRKTDRFHVTVDFDTPAHVVVTLTTASPEKGQPAQITEHDLRWLSPDCGDLKPGDVREISPPSYLKRS